MRQITCSICDCEVMSENAIEFEGQFLCSHCAEVHTYICACYENRIWADSNSGSIELPLCEDCYERHYVSCERCGRSIADRYLERLEA